MLDHIFCATDPHVRGVLRICIKQQRKLRAVVSLLVYFPFISTHVAESWNVPFSLQNAECAFNLVLRRRPASGPITWGSDRPTSLQDDLKLQWQGKMT